jgi:hypothetical protein
VDLIVQASSNDFYFSHRIFFFFQSVILDKIVNPLQREFQEQSVDTIKKSIFKVILNNVQVEIKNVPDLKDSSATAVGQGE